MMWKAQMATISENRKDGKRISFKFRAYMGRDEHGKHLFQYTTRRVPKGMSEARAKRIIAKEAEKWVTEGKQARTGRCGGIPEAQKV